MPRKTKRPARVARFNAAAIKRGRLKVPTTALRFAASVALGEAGETVPITVRARSGDAIAHWFFGRIVHDFAGLRMASSQLPFDYCHDDREVLGYCEEISTASGDLEMSGVLIPFQANDRVDEIQQKAAAGFEWQASIYFDPDELILEFLDDGQSATVNGRLVLGPCVIAREWMLRGAAICPYGYDPNTSVQFSERGDSVVVSFQAAGAKATKLASMPKKPAKKRKAKPAKAMEEGDREVDHDNVTDGDEPVRDKGGKRELLAAARREAARFVAAFGERGATWFAEGRSMDECQRMFGAELQRERAELTNRVAKLKARFWEFMGEAEPVSGGAAPGESGPGRSPTTRASGNRLSPGAEKFAAAMTIQRGKR